MNATEKKMLGKIEVSGRSKDDASGRGMLVFIYVYMVVYMYIYTYMYVYLCIYIHMVKLVLKFLEGLKMILQEEVCICIYIYTHIYRSSKNNLLNFDPENAYMYMNINTCLYTFIQMHTFIYICIYTDRSKKGFTKFRSRTSIYMCM
jgi:hypothetical protein